MNGAKVLPALDDEDRKKCRELLHFVLSQGMPVSRSDIASFRITLAVAVGCAGGMKIIPSNIVTKLTAYLAQVDNDELLALSVETETAQ